MKPSIHGERPNQPNEILNMTNKAKHSGGAEAEKVAESRTGILRDDGRRELQEHECYDHLGYVWPKWKKWSVIFVVFLVQMSMNFNTSVFPSALQGISKQYHVDEQAARVGQMIFLVMYAFGSELWAPWSEEFGRWPVLQLSMSLVNIWQIPAALSPSFGGLIVARALGGLSTAGGSVTLGMVADCKFAHLPLYFARYLTTSDSVGAKQPTVGHSLCCTF